MTRHLRDATEQDRSAIRDLHANSWRRHYADVLPAEALDDSLDHAMTAKWAARDFALPDFGLIVEEGSVVLGFVYVLSDRTPPLIDNLHVTTDMQSHGIGSVLLSAAFDRLRALGKTDAMLTVLSGNERGVAFYRRMGGREIAPEQGAILGHPVVERRLVFDLGGAT